MAVTGRCYSAAFAFALLLLNLNFRFRCVASEECGTKFVDPISSTVLAPIVLQGSFGGSTLGDIQVNYTADVLVGEVFKKADSLTSMNIRPLDIIAVDLFGPVEDRENCVAHIPATVNTIPHVFFLRPNPTLRVFQLTALPLLADKALTNQITGSQCATCIRPPEITRVKCRHCARAAVVKRLRSREVRMGKRGRLRCTAFGSPFPSFSWVKNGVPVVSGSGGITISSTNKASTLTIRQTTSAHAGQYKCIAQNAIGKSEKNADLEIIKSAQGNRHSNTAGRSRPSHSGRRGPGRCYWTVDLYCQNGGTCHSSREHSYCNCPPGFEGSTCELPVSIAGVTSDNSSTPFNATDALTSTRGSDTTVGTPGVSGEVATAAASDGSSDTISDKFQITSTIGSTNMSETTNTTESGVSLRGSSVRPSINNGDQISPSGITNSTTVSVNNTVSVLSSRREDITTANGGRPILSPTPKPRETSRREPARRRHPAASRVYANVDEEARKLIVSRLKSSRLKSSACREKRYCLNGARCRSVHKLKVKVCLCRAGFSGPRCELQG